MKFKYVEPNISYKDKAIDFVEEFKRNNSKIHGGGNIGKYLETSTYEEWLKYIEKQRQPRTNGVPDETYFLVNENDNIIGIINIRLGLNDELKELGGHIGFSIRPTERGKGYNKINLYLGLKRLNEVGVKEALLDCEVDNKASSGTMKALGGKLVCTKNTEKYGMVEDYIIDIKDSLERYKDTYEPYVMNADNKVWIRKVKPEDARGWFVLGNKVWRDAYSNIFPEEVFIEKDNRIDEKVKTFSDKMRNDNENIAYVAEYNGEIIGIMCGSIKSAYSNFNSDYADLIALYVDPKFQGYGIGTAFKNVFEEWALENGATQYVIGVLKDNMKARSVYESWGGKLSEYEEDYVKLGVGYPEVFYTYDLQKKLRNHM